MMFLAQKDKSLEFFFFSEFYGCYPDLACKYTHKVY